MSPGRRLSGIMIAGLLLLVANSAYLAAVASPTLFYYANVALHVGLGALVSVVALVYGVKTRHRWPEGASTVWVVFLLCAAVGVWLAYCRRVPRAPAALYAHGGLAAVAVLLAAAWLDRHAGGAASPRTRRLASAGVLLLCAAVVVPIIVKATLKRQWQARYAIVNPVDPPVSMEGEGGGPAQPVLPVVGAHERRRHDPRELLHDERRPAGAATRRSTTSGTRRRTTSRRSTTSGTASRSSTCRTSSARSRRSGAPAATTTRCSSTAASTGRSRSRSTRPKRRPAWRARRAIRSSTSAARWGRATSTIEYPPLHDLAASENPVLQRVHDALIYLEPEPHRDTFLKPFHREQTAEFCSSCHKVHLDVPVNGYRWFRGFNDYDNWQASGVSGQGARSFYYPPKPQKCADCHMPLVTSTRSGGEERQGALAPLPRREHGAAVRQPRPGAAEGGAGLPARRPDLGRRLRPSRAARRRRRRRERGASAPAASRALASTFAVGEESAQFGARGGR